MSSSFSGRSLLIVDDEIAIAVTLVQVFTNNGYEARFALSAEDAISIASEWPPELAIIDVALPGMSGVDLAIHFSSHFPDCRFMLFSGHPDTAAILEQAAKAGHVFQVIAKPVRPEALIAWADEEQRPSNPSAAVDPAIVNILPSGPAEPVADTSVPTEELAKGNNH